MYRHKYVLKCYMHDNYFSCFSIFLSLLAVCVFEMSCDSNQASALCQGTDENDIVPVAEEDHDFDVWAMQKRIRELEEKLLRYESKSEEIPVKEEKSVRPRVKTEVVTLETVRNPETLNKV